LFVACAQIATTFFTTSKIGTSKFRNIKKQPQARKSESGLAALILVWNADWIGRIRGLAGIQRYSGTGLMNLFRLMIAPLPVPAEWYAFPLRLMIGFGFMQHSYAKLARGPENFINVLHAMGLPVPIVLGWATIIVEIVGGVMIMAGALIPLATVPMAIVL